MAAKRPTSESAKVTPTEADTGEGTPAVAVADPAPAAPDPTSSAPTPEPVAVEAPAQQVPQGQQVVYVEAPKPFVAKSNRGFGILIALLSTVVFAVLFAVAQVIAEVLNHVDSVDIDFVGTLDFYAPVLMFAVGFILLVLVVNRAGWAAHVIGSIFVGLVVFFGGTGLILLLHVNQIPSDQGGQAFSQVLFSAGSVVGALLGREVALWMGFAIAARGRKVRARNVDARVLYDQEIAAKRAEYERANTRAASAADTGAVEPVTVEPVTVEPAVTE